MSLPTGRAARWWAEPAAVAAAWLLLAVLASGGPLTFQGVLGLPWLSVGVAFFALCLGPGLALWRWLVGGPWRHAPAWAAGLGVSWVLLPCTVAMAVGTTFARTTAAVVALNGALSAAFVVARLRARGTAEAQPDPSPTPPTAWIVAAAGVVMARLLDLGTRRLNRLTYGGDEWVFLRAVRAFVDGPTVADPHEFDAWDLLVALVVRLSRVEVFEAYRVHLPPILIVAGAFAFLALAEAVLLERGLAWLALALQGLYALSDMHTRGEGLGMAWMVRMGEDKSVALLLALPLAQAAFLALLRGRGRRHLASFALLALAATVMQPFAVPWLAFTCGVTLLAALATGLVPRSPRLLLGLGSLGTLAVAAAAALRALRPRAYFALHDTSWAFNDTLIKLSFRQLLILSLERGWYMSHPWLLTHPMIIAALLSSLLFLRGLRTSLTAQWLVLGLWVPVLLVFDPLTAVLVGRVVTPWRLYRILWSMPVALAVAAALGALLVRLESALALAPVPRPPGLERHGGPRGPLAVAALLLVALLLFPWMGEAARALRARNRVLVKPSEKAFLHDLDALAARRGLSGTVLAPEGLSVRLPGWTVRLAPLPGLAAVRDDNRPLLDAYAAFHEATAVGPAQGAWLQAYGIRFVIAEKSSPVEAALRAAPQAFVPLLEGEELTFYEWRPGYGPAR